MLSLVCSVMLITMHWSVRNSNQLVFAALSTNDDFVNETAPGTLLGEVTVTSCVTNCSCWLPSAAYPRLVIDCVDRTRGNSSFVAEEIDRVLANTKSEPINLTIVNSPLEFLPLSICRLNRLQLLILDTNRLTRFPSRCFNNMTSLVGFYAVNNSLTEIQVIYVYVSSNIYQTFITYYVKTGRKFKHILR